MRNIRVRLVWTDGMGYHAVIEGIWEILKERENVFAPLTSETVISNKLKTIYNHILRRDPVDLFRRALRVLGCIERMDAPDPLTLKMQLLHLITTQILQHTETGSESYQQAVGQKELLENLISVMDDCKGKKRGVGASAGFLTCMLSIVGAGSWLVIAEPDEDKNDGTGDQIWGGVFSAIGGIGSIVCTGLILRNTKLIKAITSEKDRLLTQLHAYTLESEAKVSYHVKHVSPTRYPIAFQNMLRVMDSILENQQKLSCHICYQTEQPKDEIADAIEIVVDDVKSTPSLATPDSKSVLPKDSELPRELSYALTETHNLGGPYHTPCIHSHLVQQQSLITEEAFEEKGSTVKDPSTNEPLLLDSIGRAQLILKDNIRSQWEKVSTTYPRLFQPATASITSITSLPTEVTAPALTTTTATTTTTTTSSTTSTTSLVSNVTATVARSLRQSWLARTFLGQSISAPVVNPVLNINGDDDSTPYQSLSDGPA